MHSGRIEELIIESPEGVGRGVSFEPLPIPRNPDTLTVAQMFPEDKPNFSLRDVPQESLWGRLRAAGGDAPFAPRVRMVELPELVQLATYLQSGNVPQVQERIPSQTGGIVLGQFRYGKPIERRGSGIVLRADLAIGPPVEARLTPKRAMAEEMEAFEAELEERFSGEELVIKRKWEDGKHLMRAW